MFSLGAWGLPLSRDVNEERLYFTQMSGKVYNFMSVFRERGFPHSAHDLRICYSFFLNPFSLASANAVAERLTCDCLLAY